MPVSLLNKLQQFLALSRDEQQAVQFLPSRIRMMDRHEDIVSEGDWHEHVSLISEGFACRYKLLKSGQRQIIAFLIPGDLCDLRSLLVHRMDHRVAALSRCRIAVIPHHRLLEAVEKHPRLALALWCDTMFDAAIYREWLTNIGGRM